MLQLLKGPCVTHLHNPEFKMLWFPNEARYLAIKEINMPPLVPNEDKTLVDLNF